MRKVVEYLYPNNKDEIFIVFDNGAWRFHEWPSSLGTPPTIETLEQTKLSAGYLTWLEEHGGDSVKTNKRKARDAFDSLDPSMVIVKALALVVADLTSQTPVQIRNKVIAKLEGLL